MIIPTGNYVVQIDDTTSNEITFTWIVILFKYYVPNNFYNWYLPTTKHV